LAIKLKNRYKVLLLILAAFSLAICLLFGNNIISNKKFLFKNPYFQSNQFEAHVADYVETLRVLLSDYTNQGNSNLDDYLATDSEKYSDLKTHLLMFSELRYYYKDKINNISTNISNLTTIDSYLKNNTLYTLTIPSNSNNTIFNYANVLFEAAGSTLYVVVPTSYKGSNIISSDYKYFSSINNRINKEFFLFILFLIILIFILYILKHTGYINQIGRCLVKIPADLDALGLIIIIYLLYMIINHTTFFYLPITIPQVEILIFIIFLTLPLMLLSFNLFYQLLSLPREEWIMMTLVHKFHNSIIACLLYPINLLKLVSLLLITMIFGAFIKTTYYNLSFLHNIFIDIMLILIYFIFIGYFFIRDLASFSKILKGTENIVSGNMDSSIEPIPGRFMSKLATNINNIKTISRESSENMMKSERLKSELITNVSHDLKTPLTSIINYVDLLKKDVSLEEKEKYISILEKKSNRLKVLIEDLFEASKLTSGAIDLNIEKIEITSVLKQALAEFEDKIAASSLEFKIEYPKDKIYLNLDGKKTWRVLENLISNALKYSMENTRVYMNFIVDINSVKIIIKNISSYEMDFDTTEIFERFKRGDKSRSSEGSGLGLTIAKSIAEAMGGSLEIQIDGDLFKAILAFTNLI